MIQINFVFFDVENILSLFIRLFERGIVVQRSKVRRTILSRICELRALLGIDKFLYFSFSLIVQHNGKFSNGDNL